MSVQPHLPLRPHRSAARGLSLLELLVAMALGLIVVLAVMSVLASGEANRRTTTGTNDMNQSGGFSITALDRALRSAGAGFSQGFDWGTLGCQLSAARSGTAVVPLSAYPAPFDGVGSAIRVAPFVIVPGPNSDIFITMGGSAPVGDIPRLVRGRAGTDGVLLDNTVGLQAGDVLLLSAKGVTNCVVTQVDDSFGTSATASGTATAPISNTGTLPLGGTYAKSNDSTVTSVAQSADAYMTALGNAKASNLQIQMFGVGTGSVLYRYDLLNSAGSAAAEPLSEGVYAMRALYGVDSDSDGAVNSWVKPAATGSYAPATVAQDAAKIRSIVGVRVAMLVRSTVYERDEVAPRSYTLFSGLDSTLQYTITLSADDRHYRYRVIETVVPLRNLLMKQPAS